MSIISLILLTDILLSIRFYFLGIINEGIRVRVIKAEKMLAPKVKIDFFKLTRLFKVSFVLRDSSGCGKSASIIYSRNQDNHSEYYAENRGVSEITWIFL